MTRFALLCQAWDSATDSRRAALLGLVAAATCVLVNWRNYLIDFVPLALVPVALTVDGTLYLDAYRGYYESLDPGQKFTFVEARGHLVPMKPVFGSLLAWPAFVPPVLYGVDPQFIGFWVGWGRLPAAAMVGVTVALAFQIARRYGSPRASLLIVGAWTFGTSVWTVAGQTLNYHTSTLLFVAATLFAIRDFPLSPTRAAWAGFLAGTAVAMRHTPVVMLLPLGLFLCWPGSVRGFRAWLAALAGVLAMPLAAAIYNHVVFGHWASTGYSEQMDLWNRPFWEGMLGQAIAPNSGTLVQSPFFALALVGTWAAAFDPTTPDRGLVRACLLGFLAYAALFAKWHDWMGGLCFSARMLSEAYPLLIPATLIGWNRIRTKSWAKPALVAACAWAILYQIAGVALFDRICDDFPIHKPWVPSEHFYLLFVHKFGGIDAAISMAASLSMWVAAVGGIAFILGPTILRPSAQ